MKTDEDLNNKQAADYYKQKIQINDSTDPYPEEIIQLLIPVIDRLKGRL